MWSGCCQHLVTPEDKKSQTVTGGDIAEPWLLHIMSQPTWQHLDESRFISMYYMLSVSLQLLLSSFLCRAVYSPKWKESVRDMKGLQSTWGDAVVEEG